MLRASFSDDDGNVVHERVSPDGSSSFVLVAGPLFERCSRREVPALMTQWESLQNDLCRSLLALSHLCLVGAEGLRYVADTPGLGEGGSDGG